jgi:hypothetical protein
MEVDRMSTHSSLSAAAVEASLRQSEARIKAIGEQISYVEGLSGAYRAAPSATLDHQISLLMQVGKEGREERD